MDTISIFIFSTIAITVFLIGKRCSERRERRLSDRPGWIRQPVFGGLTRPLAAMLPLSRYKRHKIAKELVACGIYYATATDDFLAKRNIGVATVVLLTAGLFAAGFADGIEMWVGIGGGVVCLFAFAMPRVLLSSRAERRMRRIEHQVPDALDMIALSIDAGLPLNRSLDEVAKKMRVSHPELGKELEIICRQSQSGSVELAFASFSGRVELPEIVAWSTMMQQSQRLGGRLVNSLIDYANRIREDRKNRAERAGNTASIKLLLPVVLFLSPPIAVMLIGPAILDFREFINREKEDTRALIEQATGEANASNVRNPVR
jgi:tight adherence protein C